jgi:tetratricopeptide (TPR) repeat protein
MLSYATVRYSTSRFSVMAQSSFASLLAGALCLVALQAQAAESPHEYPECNRQPSDTDVQAAKGAFQAGIVSYNEADYDRAILYWEDAFRRDCTATLLLHHLARAYEGRGDLEQAVIALRTFLERSPDAAERPQIQRRIQVFEQRILEEKVKQEAGRDHPAPAPEPTATPTAQPQPQEPSQSSSDSLRVSPLYPIVVVGVGVASTALGAILYFPARSDVKDFEDKCPDRQCPTDSMQSDANSARSRVVWGSAFGIGGLATAAAGVAWYLYNDSLEEKPAAATGGIVPFIGPQAAGVVWHSSF